MLLPGRVRERRFVLPPVSVRVGRLPRRGLFEGEVSCESATLNPTALATARIWRSELMTRTSLPSSRIRE